MLSKIIYRASFRLALAVGGIVQAVQGMREMRES